MEARKSAKLTSDIKFLLKEQITSGGLKPGDCIPSERMLTKQFSVSRVTIRRSLRELIQEGLLINKMGSGYFLPNHINTSEKNKHLKTIIFLHNNNDYDINLGKLWNGARELSIKYGLDIEVKSIDGSEAPTLNLTELKEKASGIISNLSNYKIMKQVYSLGIPLVQMYYPIEKLPVDTIVQDDIHGIYFAYSHLIEMGHRRICFFDKNNAYEKIGSHSYNHLRRRLGYQFAAEQSGFYDPNLIIPITHYSNALKDEEIFKKVIASGATALIFPNAIDQREISKPLEDACKNYASNKNTYKAIQEGNFGIISWGSNSLCQGTDKTTYVDWSKEQMGQEAMRRLLEKIQEPSLQPVFIIIPTTLTIGNSSGKGPYYKNNNN